ncbi:outer membrane lipoprotein carrier protein LolA [Tamilnaduibacter salinus]|uniref:Outer-membrane lipoprotein carrier protein n=1 Tax=Tamilnaduibacter salinus TaxID=1484056 RepID=A0A2A2I183_9GAMM|nr:outer membrane lipoprotein chaperone LolA [Tamilnaduibacter salinus]PAV24895.1 outer membrane lipoprotein carrier protein LolA [Tamilnaduibacter salinus]
MTLIGRVLLGLLLALPLAAAESDGSHDDASALADRLSDYRSFEADFRQVVVDGSGSTVQETSGRVRAKRPGLFFWKSDPPMNQTIVADGETVTVYDPDLKQVTIRDMTQRVSKTPALLLSGEVGSLSENYRVSRVGTDNAATVFELVPRSQDALFLSLRLHFRDGVVREMRLTDSLEQRTIIAFENVLLNDPISDGVFELDYPDSVDVIRDTR